MIKSNIVNFIKNVLNIMPTDWISLTTHRLDIYDEKRAKFDFLENLEELYLKEEGAKSADLASLPTAYDYIRLGHPLSCILEWAIAKSLELDSKTVITFSSQMMPVLAILRTNHQRGLTSKIAFKHKLPDCFDEKVLKKVYGYYFDLIKLDDLSDVENLDSNTIVLTSLEELSMVKSDFVIALDPNLGSIAIINDKYVSEVQHVRRRESIAMTPQDCFKLLSSYVNKESISKVSSVNKDNLSKTINVITNTTSSVAIGSSGLSVQYAIMMGLIHSSLDKYKNKEIKLIVPPNCYGGTNDQARRVADCLDYVEVLDLPVDSGSDMVQSIDRILEQVALKDAIPFIIAEIPTNPRVEVPHLDNLREVLEKKRKTKDAKDAIPCVFILDQTFCPNVKFLGQGDFLSSSKVISYVSGSKFPSGGLCTAGYCVANDMAGEYMDYVEKHLDVCDNNATNFQIEVLDKNMPSMKDRIKKAYNNTRQFVDFIEKRLPQSKINFVSTDLAQSEFTPSVFSLDLPAKSEEHKRELNLKLINMMINDIPSESKFCVSYGQLKGCYWTIPATSTQGTTKEGDKDYIVRVSVSPDFNLEKHKDVFSRFCDEYLD